MSLLCVTKMQRKYFCVMSKGNPDVCTLLLFNRMGPPKVGGDMDMNDIPKLLGLV